MKKTEFYLKFFLVVFFSAFLGILILPEKFGFLFFNQKSLSANKDAEFNFLLLGKPGYGYLGGENTDSLLIVHLSFGDHPKIYLIPIPRDLVVFNKTGKLVKINQLYASREIETLLKKASDFSGLEIKNYFVYDLHFVLGLAEILGGIEVELKDPVVDAVSLYTLSPGKRILKGDDLELVLRSRFYPDGDFHRIQNQIAVIKGFKNKFLNLTSAEKIKILKFAFAHRQNWETNLNQETIYFLLNQSEKFKGAEIKTIFLTPQNKFLTSSYFKIENTEGVYGIYPTLGIDNFSALQNYILSQLKN